MRLGRLRAGEWTAVAAAVLLAFILALDWYELRSAVATVGQSESGYGSLGWFAVALIALAIIGVLTTAVFTVSDRTPAALPVTGLVVTLALAVLAVLAIVVRLIFQPGLGVDAPNAEVAVQPPALLGLFTALIMVSGLARALADERTDTPEAHRQTERVLAVRGAPRPAPPPGADTRR